MMTLAITTPPEAEALVALAIEASVKLRQIVSLSANSADERAMLAECIETRTLFDVASHADGVTIYFGELGWRIRLEGVQSLSSELVAMAARAVQ